MWKKEVCLPENRFDWFINEQSSLLELHFVTFVTFIKENH